MAGITTETYTYENSALSSDPSMSETETAVLSQVKKLVPGFVAFGIATLLIKFYG